jgi:hypothetical protein
MNHSTRATSVYATGIGRAIGAEQWRLVQLDGEVTNADPPPEAAEASAVRSEADKSLFGVLRRPGFALRESLWTRAVGNRNNKKLLTYAGWSSRLSKNQLSQGSGESCEVRQVTRSGDVDKIGSHGVAGTC